MRAIELDPEEADYWTELGWLSFERRDFESARRNYQLSYALPAALGAVTLGIAIYGIVTVATYEPAGVALRVGPRGASLEGRF